MLVWQKRPGVPQSTQLAARGLLKKKKKRNLYVSLHDELDAIFSDEDFAELFSHKGQPALAPWRIVLLLIVQYLEDLSDRAMMEQLEARIDLKYLLELEIDADAPAHSVLCKFRERLVAGDMVDRLLERLLEHLAAKGVKKDHRRLRTDATAIHSAARQLNRLELCHEALHQALLAIVDADEEAETWLRERMPVAWLERYAYSLGSFEGWHSDDDAATQLQQIAEDGMQLLTWLNEANAPKLQAKYLMAMRLVWIQQFALQDEQVVVREQADLPPCSQRITTFHDLEARFASHGKGKEWHGYRLHVTEKLSNDPQTPQLIVHVATTVATTPDKVAFVDILSALPDHEIHLVDTGYTTLENAERAQNRQIDLVGRMQVPGHKLLDQSLFVIDWERQQVTCPQGEVSTKWTRTPRHGQMCNQVYFDKSACAPCPLRSACTTSKTRGRSLRFFDEDRHKLLQHLRQRQKTQAFKDVYRQRAGIEGTISQLVRGTHLRVSRYIGLAKTHLHNTLAAVAVNLTRWFRSTLAVERAQRRKSRLLPALA